MRGEPGLAPTCPAADSLTTGAKRAWGLRSEPRHTRSSRIFPLPTIAVLNPSALPADSTSQEERDVIPFHPYIWADAQQRVMACSIRVWYSDGSEEIAEITFTPSYASWLNQVEIWFNRITQQAIRRGTFGSVKELVAKIDQYVKNSNRRSQPFVWTATADSILTNVERLCERIYGTAHQWGSAPARRA